MDETKQRSSWLPNSGRVGRRHAIALPLKDPGSLDVSSRDRLPTLTGLRFWAALLVVLYHLNAQIGHIPGVSSAVEFGRTGVTFFFVLSGFVLAWTYYGRATPLSLFLWRRFARLWPILAVTGLASLAVYWAIGVRPGAAAAASTFVFLQAWVPRWSVGANPAAWSLSDEAFFYLCFPLLLGLATRSSGRTRIRMVIALCLAVIPVWILVNGVSAPNWLIDYFPPARLLQFAIGLLCGVLMKRGARAPVGLAWALCLVVLFHLLLVPWTWVVPPSQPFGAYSGSQWLSAPLFALVIMAAADADLHRSNGAAKSDWALRLGHWSYSWYLIHEVVIRLWSHFSGAQTGLFARVLAWGSLLALTLLAAALLYTVVERPAERFLRRRMPGSVT